MKPIKRLDNIRKIVLHIVSVLLSLSVIFFIISEAVFYSHKERIVSLLDSKELSVIILRNNINIIVFCFIIILVVALIIFYVSEYKLSKLSDAASNVRKLLLEVTTRPISVSEALKIIAETGEARAAFYIDTELKSYTYICDRYNKEHYLTNKEISLLVTYLLECAEKRINDNINIINLDINKKIINPDLKKFMLKYELKNIIFSAIVEDDNHMSLLAVENPDKNLTVTKLLKEISVCFSMSIYNKEYLEKTENLVITDSLTGAYNRLAFNRDEQSIISGKISNKSCVYIDVNELHIFNNKYGHYEGDKMLKVIASKLKEVFCNDRIYRMGGDEFLVLSDIIDFSELERLVSIVKDSIEEKGYHISSGIATCNEHDNVADTLQAAESRMYDQKNLYYQNKKELNMQELNSQDLEQRIIEIMDIDSFLSVFNLKFKGAYMVDISADKSKNIYTSINFKNMLDIENGKFSKAIVRYADKAVEPEDQRALLSFCNYESVCKMLKSGINPSITYRKINGNQTRLTIYSIHGVENINETLWIFE